MQYPVFTLFVPVGEMEGKLITCYSSAKRLMSFAHFDFSPLSPQDMNNQYPFNWNWGNSPHHTRPFFCVPPSTQPPNQPPNQPYFTTNPWNMNPYSQYGFPWPGILTSNLAK